MRRARREALEEEDTPSACGSAPRSAGAGRRRAASPCGTAKVERSVGPNLSICTSTAEPGALADGVAAVAARGRDVAVQPHVEPAEPAARGREDDRRRPLRLELKRDPERRRPPSRATTAPRAGAGGCGDGSAVEMRTGGAASMSRPGRSSTSTDDRDRRSRRRTRARRRRAAGCARAAASRRRRATSRSPVFTSSVCPYDVSQSCERCSELPPGAHDAGRRRGAARRRARAARARAPVRVPEHDEPDERADPGRGAEDVQRVGGDVHAVDARVVRVPGERGRDDETEREHERRAAARAARASPHRRSVATTIATISSAPNALPARVSSPTRCASSPAPIAASTQAVESEKRDALAVARPGDERAERDADGGEQPGEEDPARDDVGGPGPLPPGGERGARRLPLLRSRTRSRRTRGGRRRRRSTSAPSSRRRRARARSGMTSVRSPATLGRPPSTEPPPFRIASMPGPVRTTSSKTTRISAGASASDRAVRGNRPDERRVRPRGRRQQGERRPSDEDGEPGRTHFRRYSRSRCYRRARAVQAVRRRRPRVCLLPRRRRAGGNRRRRRPCLRDRAVSGCGEAPRASSSSACSRRTRTPTTSRGTAGSRSSTACRCRPRGRRAAFPHEPLADGTEIELGEVVAPRRSTRPGTGRSTAHSR